MTESELADRTYTTAVFSLPLEDVSLWDAYFAAPSGERGDAMADAEVLAEMRTLAGPAVPVRGLPASVGRGASGFGVALELFLDVGAVGGTIGTLAASGRLVRAAFRSLRTRYGHRPGVSQGAAVFLAAAHLADHLGTDAFNLLGSGETDQEVPDRSFTGRDSFWAIFTLGRDVYLYAVSSTGHVQFLGEHAMREPQGVLGTRAEDEPDDNEG